MLRVADEPYEDTMRFFMPWVRSFRFHVALVWYPVAYAAENLLMQRGNGVGARVGGVS